MLTSMTQQANTTIDRAMNDGGGRGSHTTTTDYSTLSNAFMKKAQLDLNIAELHSDNTNQRASLLSNLDIEKANMHMKGASLDLQYGMYRDQVKREEEANKLNTFEQISGVLAGAAQGAQAGNAVAPGGKGAIIGGVLGGAMTMGAGNQRNRQQHTLQNIGMISTAATAIGAQMDKKKGEDALETWTNDYSKWSKILQTSAPGSQQHQEAQANIETSIAGFGKVAQMNGVPLHQSVAQMGELRKQAYGQGYVDPTDTKAMGNKSFRETLIKGQSDSLLQKGDPTAVKEFQDKLAFDYMQANPGTKVTKGMMKTWMNNVGQGFVDADGNPAPQSNFGDKYVGGGKKQQGNGGTQSHSDSGIDSMQQPMSQGTKAASTRQGTTTVTPPAADQSGATRPTVGPGNVFGGSVGTHYGVTMDKNNEIQLTEQIGKNSAAIAENPELVAKATGRTSAIDNRPSLDEGDQGRSMPSDNVDDVADEKQAKRGKDMSLLQKIKHNMSLSPEEFDSKKIPIWKHHAETVDDGSKEGRKTQDIEDFKKADKALTKEIENVAADTPEGARAKSAVDIVDMMAEEVMNGGYPSGSSLKQFGSDVRQDGINVGKSIGGAAGLALTKGKGRAGGAAVGYMIAPDLNMGKGSGPFLSDKEELAVDNMEKFRASATMKFAKINDPDARAVSDADAKRFEPLWPRPGQTKEQQLAGLLTIKEMMLAEAKGAAKASAADMQAKYKEKYNELKMSQDMQMDTFHMKERAKVRYKDEVNFLDEEYNQ